MDKHYYNAPGSRKIVAGGRTWTVTVRVDPQTLKYSGEATADDGVLITSALTHDEPRGAWLDMISILAVMR